VERAVERGVNVVDTAINYSQPAQRARRRRRAGRRLPARSGCSATRSVVTTKGGYLASTAMCRPIRASTSWRPYVRSGIIQPGDIVGSHCMTPAVPARPARSQPGQLGLETVDVYYLHNPKTQLDEVSPASKFLERVRAALRRARGGRAEGKLRFYGAATWNGFRADPGGPGYLSLPELVQVAREVGGADHRFRVIQLPYNLAMPEAFTRANQKLDGGSSACWTCAPSRRLRHGLGLVMQGQLTPEAAGRARRAPAGLRPMPSGRSSSSARRPASARRWSA
jgi:aryl-alcohol dehydrogenase-like predicted oxidoreductase